MSRPGVTLALGSVALVSLAQLGMRWSMSRLPSPTQLLEYPAVASIDFKALAVIGVAIGAYALSMLLWLLALRSLS